MNSLELPTLISKEKIDNRKQTWKIRVKENNKNSSLIEIETGPEGGDCFIYEEEFNISKKRIQTMIYFN